MDQRIKGPFRSRSCLAITYNPNKHAAGMPSLHEALQAQAVSPMGWGSTGRLSWWWSQIHHTSDSGKLGKTHGMSSQHDDHTWLQCFFSPLAISRIKWPFRSRDCIAGRQQSKTSSRCPLLAGPTFAGPSCVADGLRINRASVLMIITGTAQ